jgi:hypothetical protein
VVLQLGALGEALTTPSREKKQNKMFENYSQARCFLWRQNNLAVKYCPTIQVAGACEYGNKLSGCSIKCGEFLD